MPGTLKVETRAALLTALRQAGNGETILLAAGDYGKLRIGRGDGAEMVSLKGLTLRASDPEMPPVFRGLDVRGVAEMTLDGLVFDYTRGPRRGDYDHPFGLYDSADIALSDCTFRGNIDPRKPSLADRFGVGLWIQNVTGVRLTGNTLSGFDRGIVARAVEDLLLRENDMHTIGSIGIEGTGIEQAFIEGNHLHDFWQPPTVLDLPDMIQFSAGPKTRANRDIVIRNNWLDMGRGCATRSIVILADIPAGRTAPACDTCDGLSIQGNMILNADFHGIMVDRSRTVMLGGNILLHTPGAGVRRPAPVARETVPRIIVDPEARDVTVHGNAAAAIDGLQLHWDVLHNGIIRYDEPATAQLCHDALVRTALDPRGGVKRFAPVRRTRNRPGLVPRPFPLVLDETTMVPRKSPHPSSLRKKSVTPDKAPTPIAMRPATPPRPMKTKRLVVTSSAKGKSGRIVDDIAHDLMLAAGPESYLGDRFEFLN